VSAEQLELIKQSYQRGKVAFERGEYRQSVQQLETAAALVERNTRLGGEIQIWLVTAYEAAGQRTQSLELCRQLRRHPHWDTRTQSKRLQYILEAPQLVRPDEWLTKIPDLSQLDEESLKRFQAQSSPSSRPKVPEPTKFVPEDVDFSQVKTDDPQFVWIALGITVVILGSLYWLS
jgi:hypothetical protein